MTTLAAADVLALHRELVATPSVSGSEGAIAAKVAAVLAALPCQVRRVGDSVLALAGSGPLLLLDSHLDTVPPGPGWSTPPFSATVMGDRVQGLGASDAKASVAAMTAAFASLAGERLGITLGLALVASEETTSGGTQDVLQHLAQEGRAIAGAVFGEPTGLDLAVAQKGLLVLELSARGESRHAARAAGEPSAVRVLARDLQALESVDLGPQDPFLGPATVEPTVLRAGEARNVVPAEATATLDVRTTPALPPAELVARLRAVLRSEVRVLSDRLPPRATLGGCALLRAARAASAPGAREVGSPTLSDWALLPPSIPALKAGPGCSTRSHRADEFVLESEVLDGAAFYARLVRAFAREVA